MVKLCLDYFFSVIIATEDSSGKVSSKNGVHASSRTTVNTEESPEHIPTEASDMVGEVMTSDNVALESSEPAVGAPSLLRRKRVLPNLGSASKRRHSSVSRDPRESDAAVHEEGPVVVLETTAVVSVTVVDPSSPDSDMNKICHNYVIGLSAREVMRIENMITQARFP